jgi:hypothetical protein
MSSLWSSRISHECWVASEGCRGYVLASLFMIPGLVFSSMLFYCMALFDYFNFHIDILRAEAGE